MTKIAIIGRPNVGKSTLFNRLTGKHHALVHDEPGVTRDRRFGEASLGQLKFQVIDTAGLDDGDKGSIQKRMMEQTEIALNECDFAFFVVDSKEGITPQDKFFANWLRKSGKKIILVANKAEKQSSYQTAIAEFQKLGFGEPVCISAAHGDGMLDLYQAVAENQPEEDDADSDNFSSEIDVDLDDDSDEEKAIQIAIVGRPNAGKSTLLNALIGENRVLTGAEPGLTRDSIAVEWEFEGSRIKLVDTAGMRRRAKVNEGLERMAVKDTLRTIQYAHVVILLLDAEIPLEKQDLNIARLVIDEGRALVIAINKWDKVEVSKETYMRALEGRLSNVLPQVKGVPVITISAKQGKNIKELVRSCLKFYEIWNRKISTSQINQWLSEVETNNPPPAVMGRKVRLKYATQTKSRPPSFIIFSSRPEKLPSSYIRYLLNSLRESFKLPGVPIRLSIRKTDNPYKDK